MNILIVNGSPARQSNTRALSKTVLHLLQNHPHVEVSFFDVGADPLPLYTGEPDELRHPAVQKWMNLAKRADAFFICTPEYHNGISGALKNALDFLGKSHFRRKPVAIAAAAGGGKGGINALNNLRLVMRGLYAWVLPEQVVADPHVFNARGEIGDAQALERLGAMVDELVAVTQMLHQKEEQTYDLGG